MLTISVKRPKIKKLNNKKLRITLERRHNLDGHVMTLTGGDALAIKDSAVYLNIRLKRQ
jgi:hypothetical protein